MTALVDAPATSLPPGRRPDRRRTAALIGVLLLGALAMLAVTVLRAAPGLARFDEVTPAFGGAAQTIPLPTYGPEGMYVVGYDHGTTTMMSLPIRNGGWLPITVTSVALGGGVAPLLAVRDVGGLPLSIGPGQTGTVEVTAELANCKYFHEREAQFYDSVELGFSVLGQQSTQTVAYDRPIMVKSPMIVRCPDRKIDRQADDRRDLTGAA